MRTPPFWTPLPSLPVSLPTSSPAMNFESGEIRRFTGHTTKVVSVAFSPDNRYATTGSFDGARLWDVQTGKELRQFVSLPGSDGVWDLAFSPDGTYIIGRIGLTPTVLWDAQTGQEIRRFSYTGPGILSPDGKHIFLGGASVLIDAATGEVIHTFKGSGVRCAAFSPDGRYIVVCTTTSEGYVAQLWNTQTGEVIRTFSGNETTHHTDQILAVAYSPNGRYVLTGSQDKTVRLWDVATANQVRTFVDTKLTNAKTTHTDGVFAVAFSPDTHYVLTGSFDKMAKLWDVESGTLLNTLHHPGEVFSVAFSPDGNYFLTGSDNGLVRLWDTKLVANP